MPRPTPATSGSTGAPVDAGAPSTREVVLGYIDALNGGDPDDIAGRVTDDFFNEHTSSLGHSLRGRIGYRQRLPSFLERFAGLHYDVEDVIVDGDRAAVAYRLSGAVADGAGRRPFAVRGVFRFRVEGGSIAHRVDYWDSADFERQVAPR